MKVICHITDIAILTKDEVMSAAGLHAEPGDEATVSATACGDVVVTVKRKRAEKLTYARIGSSID